VAGRIRPCEHQGVRLQRCNHNGYQYWNFSVSARDSFLHYQGQCLDGSVSQGVRLAACNGGSYQQWRWSSWAATEDNIGAIKHIQSGLCLDGSLSQGIRLVACNDSPYQTWMRRTYY
jgi:hypothetical protein